MEIITQATGEISQIQKLQQSLKGTELPLSTNILCFDTTTEICSVALTNGGKVLAYRENTDGHSHAKTLLPFIEEVLKEAGRKPEEIDAIALSMGPGSYTGLRIGTSTAKGLCYSLDKPLIAVPTLQIIASGAQNEESFADDTLFCPLLDARRMEVFTALYDMQLAEKKGVEAVVVNEETFTELLKGQKVVFCGNGAEKCKPLYENNPNAIFVSSPISARAMASIALDKFLNKQFEDVAYFDPLYGKDYVAAKPTVKGLH